MKSQVIKDKVPKKNFYNFLDNICIKEDNKYILSSNSYKKLLYDNKLNDLINLLIPYYFDSKKFYLTQIHTYASFLTIIRQVCKGSDIKYDKKVEYIKSIYKPLYKIEITND